MPLSVSLHSRTTATSSLLYVALLEMGKLLISNFLISNSNSTTTKTTTAHHCIKSSDLCIGSKYEFHRISHLYSFSINIARPCSLRYYHHYLAEVKHVTMIESSIYPQIQLTNITVTTSQQFNFDLDRRRLLHTLYDTTLDGWKPSQAKFDCSFPLLLHFALFPFVNKNAWDSWYSKVMACKRHDLWKI